MPIATDWNVITSAPAPIGAQTTRLSESLDALLTWNSQASGTRPAYVTSEGEGRWIHKVSGTNWAVYHYDGSHDILVGNFNPTDNTWTPAGNMATLGGAHWGAETSIASAATTDLGTVSTHRAQITGTTGITSFGTGVNLMRLIRFSGVLTITHNGTSLILPNAINITTAAGDMALVTSDASGNWRMHWFSRATGVPLYESAFGGIRNLELSVSNASNALTIALKTEAGNDPTGGDPIVAFFPSATEGSGTLTRRTITAATSLVLSSGSTMGTGNSEAFRIWIVLFDDGGTLRLGAINCRIRSGATINSIYRLNGHGRATTTAEGGAGAADSAHVFYTGTAIGSAAPYIVLGYIEYGSGLSTAGTWNANPSRIRLWKPGDALPNDIIQRQVGTATAEVSHSSTSYTDTNLDVTITPDSAANVIEIQVTAAIYLVGSGTGVAVFAKLHRDGTIVTTVPAQELYMGGTSPLNISSGGTHGFDLAGTTSARTYDMRTRVGAGGGGDDSVEYPEASGGDTVGEIVASEIMA